jgi:2-polyprenyl-6-methoxyphenol hydroxylase-like FAD-dependent oxidoreductase
LILPPETDVLIVGAGPCGLTLAAMLAQASVRFVLIDRQAEGANTSRAAVVHARTLEALEELQIAERLVSSGIIVPKFTVRDRDHVLARVDFSKLPTKYPYTLMSPQNVTEAILLDRLRQLGGEVCRPYALEKLCQEPTHVEGTIAGTDQVNTAILRARYVVGCDGMHSKVREQAGFTFRGGTYEQSFVLADVRMKSNLSSAEVTLFFSPQGLVVVAPLPGGHYRIVATLDEAPEHPNLKDVQQLLDARGPANDVARIEEVIWSSRFRVHHRLADKYRIGRVLVAGDAAHVHSPAGGQGMNTGIQDAVALGHALTSMLMQNAPDGALDEYERKRRQVAEHVVAMTDRMTRIATLRPGLGRVLRNTCLRILDHSSAFKRNLAMDLSELRFR